MDESHAIVGASSTIAYAIIREVFSTIRSRFTSKLTENDHLFNEWRNIASELRGEYDSCRRENQLLHESLNHLSEELSRIRVDTITLQNMTVELRAEHAECKRANQALRDELNQVKVDTTKLYNNHNGNNHD